MAVLVGYCDSDWGGSMDDSKTHLAMLFRLEVESSHGHLLSRIVLHSQLQRQSISVHQKP